MRNCLKETYLKPNPLKINVYLPYSQYILTLFLLLSLSQEFMLKYMTCYLSLMWWAKWHIKGLRGAYSRHWIDFGSNVSGRFKIELCIHIGFNVIVNPFIYRVKYNSITRSNEYRIIGSILNTSTHIFWKSI